MLLQPFIVAKKDQTAQARVIMHEIYRVTRGDFIKQHGTLVLLTSI